MHNLEISKLNFEEEKEFKKRVKIRMIEQELEYADLSMRTGYSERSICNALCSSGTMTKFLTGALAEALNIDLNEIRREKNGK